MPELKTNPLKPKLQSRDFVLGTFVEIPSPQLVEVLGLAGFDFVVIDREHGAIDLHDTEEMVRACLSTDLSPIVRVPACDPVLVRQPLDMGATGIHVPQIDSAAAAEASVRYSKFFPQGERGMQPFVRSASYRAGDTAEYLRTANDALTIVLHIEGQKGVDELDSILALPGVDVVFIGPYDLSQSLGIPGQVKHPRVREKMLDVLERTRKAGKYVGTYCDDIPTALEWQKLGVSYITVSMDAYMLYTAARDIVQGVRKARP
jgi:4-hydroxy-2-oxoheptanedioate aldolase